MTTMRTTTTRPWADFGVVVQIERLEWRAKWTRVVTTKTTMTRWLSMCSSSCEVEEETRRLCESWTRAWQDYWGEALWEFDCKLDNGRPSACADAVGLEAFGSCLLLLQVARLAQMTSPEHLECFFKSSKTTRKIIICITTNYNIIYIC